MLENLTSEHLEIGMRNALAAYAILIPMLIAVAVMSAPTFEEVFRAMKASPSVVHDVVGDVYLESGKYQQALDELNKAVKADPDSAVAYNDRACAYQGLNNHRQAIADCDKSLSLNKDPNTYVTRGFSFGQVGDVESQIRDYETAIKLKPGFAEAYYYRARAYEKQGKTELAKRDRDKAQSLGYKRHAFVEYQMKQ